MSDDVLSKVVSGQRRRLVASIMGCLEREVWDDITPEQQRVVRSKVMSSIGVFSDFTLDCIRASSQGAYVNADALETYDQLNRER